MTVNKAGTGKGKITSSPAGIDCGATCAVSFNMNSSVTLTAAPDPGSKFDGWGEACTGTAATCTVTLGRTKTANFRPTNQAASTTTYRYDPNGNLTQVGDPNGNVRKAEYDSLDQAIRELEPDAATPGNSQGLVDTDYDGLGRVKEVSDSRNLSTLYGHDSLGNLLTLTSPDTGTTTSTYDDAGNLKTKADARGKVASYSYDSENRLTLEAYDDQAFTYTWDSCANGIGRLCGVAYSGNSVTFSYEPHGRLATKNQTLGAVTLAVAHHYNTDGQRDETILPSGRTIGYDWLDGRVDSITLNGQPIVSQILYEPDGQVGGWTWGNGTVSERFYNLNGRPVAVSLGFDAQNQLPDTRSYYYDAASRVTAITADIDPALDTVYGYDGLDRLVSSQHGALTSKTYGYSYDLSGNRTGKVVDGTNAETSTIDPGSNRLTQKVGGQTVTYTYDPAGNRTGDGTITYGYTAQGRRTSATGAGLAATYQYNGLGHRVAKTVNGATTLYAYDGHGHLIGEYNAAGQLIQEILWLGGLPIAAIKPIAPQSQIVDIHYIHADHLGTPRRITRASDNRTVWAWEGEAFGAAAPNQDPSGLGNFAFNLRFPGQYFDAETGLNYNYYRDYDPANGRYVQSDPIGLAGGINTYAYVGGNPVNLTDPRGLEVTMTCRPVRIPILGKEMMVGKHCAVFVCHWDKCKNKKVIDSQFSVEENGTRPTNNYADWSTWDVDRKAFNGNFPGGDSENYEIPIPNNYDSQAEFDQAVTESGNKYSQQKYDAVNGPNSNTAADNIIEFTGASVPNVPGAWNQNWGH